MYYGVPTCDQSFYKLILEVPSLIIYVVFAVFFMCSEISMAELSFERMPFVSARVFLLALAVITWGCDCWKGILDSKDFETLKSPRGDLLF